MAFVLAKFGNVDLVWWSYPIAEIMSAAMTIIFLIKLNREVISKISSKEW